MFSFHRLSEVSFLSTHEIARKIIDNRTNSTHYTLYQKLSLINFFSSYYCFLLIFSEFIEFIGCCFTCGDTMLCNWPLSIHLCIFSANYNLNFIGGRYNTFKYFILSSKSHMQYSIQSKHLFICIDPRIIYMEWLWVKKISTHLLGLVSI